MPTYCDLITAGFTPDCTNELTAGVNDRVWLGNKSEISSLSRNVSENNIIEAITLNSGANLYEYVGKKFSNKPSARLVEAEFSSAFEHQLDFYIFGDGNAVKKQIEEMKHGNLVAIVQNNFEGASGAAAFSMYGTKNGLVLREMEQNKGDNASLGGYRLSLRSHPEALEPYLPNDVYDTDLATTLAMLNALI